MHITLPLELHSSKNSQQIITLRTGRRMIIKNKYARSQDRILDILLPANKRKWEIMKGTRRTPLYVCFYVYRQTNRRSDINNLTQGLFDAMTRHGYLEDDSWQKFIPIFVGVGLDKHNPRVLIWLYDESKTLTEQFVNEMKYEKQQPL